MMNTALILALSVIGLSSGKYDVDNFLVGFIV